LWRHAPTRRSLTGIAGCEGTRERFRELRTPEADFPTFSTIGATLDDRGINLAVFRWDPPATGTHTVTVTATDRHGAAGQSTFAMTGTS
jgi:hypothetical protein